MEIYNNFDGFNHFTIKILSLSLLLKLSTLLIESTIETRKNVANEKRRRRGLLSAGAGASLLSTGFILQYILYEQGISFSIIMYTLTLIGVSLIFYAAVQFFS
jgi:hypothetical protein